MKVEEGCRRPCDSGHGFSSFNTTALVTLVGPPTASIEEVFLDHQGIGGYELLSGRGECGLRCSARVVVAYCSYCPWIISPSSFSSVCPSNTLVMNYLKGKFISLL